MNTSCHMGCDPPERGGEERFYLYFSFGITIYGHTIDEWARDRFPEDVPTIERGRLHGREYGCWHSVAVPDGEFGTNPARDLHDITYDQFMQAQELGWPDIRRGL